MKRFVAVGCSLLMAAAHPAAALMQVADGATIARVDFEGLQRTKPEFAADVVGLSAGSAVSTTILDEAVARLVRTGRFLSVSYETAEEPGGVVVRFRLRERAVITAIRFIGHKDFAESKLTGIVGAKVGDPADLYIARDGRDAIAAAYREKGFKDVAVSLNEDLLAQTGELVYTITEGSRVRVRKIQFEGIEPVLPRELRRILETKTYVWIFRSGAFDEEAVEGDLARLRQFFQDRGYLDARAGYRVESAGKPGDLTVTFAMEKGTLYGIENIEFRGQTVFTEEELNGAIASRVGETVRPPRVEADAKAIRDQYGRLGHIYAGVKVIRVFSTTPGLVRLTFDIDEGGQFRVGQVAVRGNTRTKDKVVRRELNLYPPDDLFDLTEARAAEKRLTDTRIFSSAKVIPTGDEPGVRDAVIDVKESEKLGDFLFGAGITSNNGLVGTIVLDLPNFDAADYPRSWSEFFKLRSFQGAGQRMRIELTPGTEVNRARVDFIEPYFLDRAIRFDNSYYLFERDRDGYTESRYGASVGLGKKFDRGVLRDWSGEISLRIEDVTIDDLDLFTASRIRDDEGSNFLNGVKGTMLRDRTDNRFLPTSGDRLVLGYEQFGLLGGDVFGKATAEYSYFMPLWADALERKTVIELRAEGGVIAGDAPVYERFYAGGVGSIRGFEYRGVGEREGIDKNNVGGDYLLLLGAEYSYPIYAENIRGHFFVDTGTAGSGPYRAAIGAGIRLTINFLGPLPLEFNLAAPIAKDGDDDEQVFSFLIGRVF